MKDRKRKKTKIRLSKKEQDRKKKKPTIDTDCDLNVTNAYKINKLVKNQQLLNLTCMHACMQKCNTEATEREKLPWKTKVIRKTS